MTKPCPKCGGDMCDGLALCHGCREDLFRKAFRRLTSKEFQDESREGRERYCADLREKMAANGETRPIGAVLADLKVRGRPFRSGG